MVLVRARRAATRLSPRHISRYYSNATGKGKLTIGIRREDPERIWERRCPLTPEAVRELIKDEDVDVLVQPCERRVWTGQELLQVRIFCCTANQY